MAKATSPSSRVRITENGEALRVVVSARRNYLMLIYLPVWLTVWAFGEVMVPFWVLTGKMGSITLLPVLFLLLWFCLYTAGGAWGLAIWCWNAQGREYLTASSGDGFSVRYEAFGVGKTWVFDVKQVRNVRVVETATPSWFRWYLNYAHKWNQIGIWRGPLAFDYGAKTYRFGAGMDEAEARQLPPLLLNRLSPGEGR